MTSKNEHGSPRFKSKRRKRDRWPVRGAWRLLWFITVGIPVTPRRHIPPAIQGTRSSCLGAKHHRKAAKSGLAVLLQTHLWFQGAFELCAGNWVGEGTSERGGGRKLLTKSQCEAKRRMLGVAGRSWWDAEQERAAAVMAKSEWGFRWNELCFRGSGKYKRRFLTKLVPWQRVLEVKTTS